MHDGCVVLLRVISTHPPTNRIPLTAQFRVNTPQRQASYIVPKCTDTQQVLKELSLSLSLSLSFPVDEKQLLEGFLLYPSFSCIYHLIDTYL